MMHSLSPGDALTAFTCASGSRMHDRACDRPLLSQRFLARPAGPRTSYAWDATTSFSVMTTRPRMSMEPTTTLLGTWRLPCSDGSSSTGNDARPSWAQG